MTLNPIILIFIILHYLSILISYRNILVYAHNQLSTFGITDPITTSEVSMFVKVDKTWCIPPLNAYSIIKKLGPKKRDISQYIIDYLANKPLAIRFHDRPVQRRSRKGDNPFSITHDVLTQKYLSWVTCGSNAPCCGKDWKSVKKLQSIWSIDKQSSELRYAVHRRYQNRHRYKESKQYFEQVNKQSYEEAVIDFHGMTLDLEILLPRKLCGGIGTVAPVILYRFPIGPGLLEQPNEKSKWFPKTRVTHSRGIVKIYPRGRRMDNRNDNSSREDDCVQIGCSSMHIYTGPGIIDDHWARGKRIFWNGRYPGLI